MNITMTKKKVLILGTGFAGLRAFYRLREQRSVDVVLVDSRSTSLEKPSLPEVAFAGKPVQHVQIPLEPIINHHGGKFIQANAVRIDPQNQVVELAEQEPVGYDYLLIALGAVKNYNAIAGFQEFGFSVCDDHQAPRLYQKLTQFQGGPIVVGSARTDFGHRVKAPVLAAPCEGPIGETVFMLNYKLKRRGLDKKSPISVFSPGAEFFDDVGAKVHAVVGPLLEKQNVAVQTRKVLKQIFADHVLFADGSTMESALTVIIPPYTGPQIVKDSGLGDEMGFVPTDTQMRHLDHPNIFAAGDGNALSMPKLGHIAIHQADIAAAAILKDIEGTGEIPEFEPEIFCIMNRGGEEATLILSDELFGGRRDIARNGSISHMMKWSFDTYYFYTKGHMPPEFSQTALEFVLEKME